MFSPNGKKTQYHFETDLLSGILQPTGHRHGIRKLIHKPTGLSLIHPDFSLLNLYLLFATGQCLASARSIERTITASDSDIHVHWEPSRQHRVALKLSYHLVPPNIIDLTITAHTREDYPAYEALLANYFDLAFKPHIYISGGGYDRNPRWFTPELQHLYRDNALIFPRNAETAHLHRDGRWSNVRSIYRWKTQHYYAQPLAMQVHPEHRIAIALMTHPDQCASLSWTVGFADIKVSSYGSDHLDDHHNARNPLYMSLFGHQIHALNTYTAHVRLAVIDLDTGLQTPINAYQDFANTYKKTPH